MMSNEPNYRRYQDTPFAMLVTLSVCSAASAGLAITADTRRGTAFWALVACSSVVLLFRYVRELFRGTSDL
ncbi:MAG: hypothetical protein Q8Q09_18620 [Deltaproteobacteria bacterium]|nr:hypothetical protein [Deltaproteobacteria bacterium]